MDLKAFKLELQRQFHKMKDTGLFKVNVDKDVLWNKYLDSFPAGTNEIYREKRTADCNCCRSFIKNVGNVVTIVDNKIVSIFDIKVNDGYQEVADSLSAFVKSSSIENVFLHFEKQVGTDKTFSDILNGVSKTFTHLSLQLPDNVVVSGADIGTKLGLSSSTRGVFARSLEEISIESLNTVLDLIAQNSLYKGEENKFAVGTFKKLKVEYDKLSTVAEKELFTWSKFAKLAESVSKIKNTAIGTLLTDLSEGKEIEYAVKSFETKVAPTNYKRPTALITKAMIDKAKITIEELGLTSSLERRYAVLEDITVNNIIYVDRTARKRIDNVFDELSSKIPDKVKSIDKVEEVSIEDFVTKIIPTISSMEVMLENKHSSNLVSLIAPVDMTSKKLFKWDNPFSWSYNGDVTDSVKERVKAQGGTVDADFRCSLSWFNYDDLDLHMLEPGGHEIFFRNKGCISPAGGMLDVDMNAGGGSTRNAVENIFYKDKSRMKEGVYTLIVNQYNKRETKDVGFDMQIEFDGVVTNISYSNAVTGNVVAAKFNYSKKEGLKIIESLPSSQTVKEVWGISSQSFHKVNVMMYSPNFWDDQGVGNKHYFFMLDKCINDGQARGFYNEFLTSELDVHRKVLEVVGSKMKTENSADQLSGLGFSSTQRNSVLVKVQGSFSRILKILF